MLLFVFRIFLISFILITNRKKFFFKFQFNKINFNLNFIYLIIRKTKKYTKYFSVHILLVFHMINLKKLKLRYLVN